MLQVVDPKRHELAPVASEGLENAGWIHAVEPGPGDRARLEALGVPAELLRHTLDPEELARTERHASGAQLVILRAPWMRSAAAAEPPGTCSVSMVLLRGRLVTIEPRDTGLVAAFALADRREEGTDPAQIVFRFCAFVAERFIHEVRVLDAAVEKLEDELRSSLRNEEVLALLRYQKGLTHFETALASNRIMLERLRENAPEWQSFDRRLLDEALVEMHQAIAMTSISTNILSQMMDAFASIISNNLNAVMKVLASLTIILGFPVIVSSLYGMNVALPFAQHPHAFWIMMALSAVAAAAVAGLFRRWRWL
jgi:magnesium transporter